MSYKQYVPQTTEDWDTYWTQTSIDKEIALTKTDGLGPIFKKYLRPDGVNLEAGCGLGKWVIALKNQKYQIIGLDNYVKGLKNLKKYDSSLSLQAGDVQALPLSDNSIDAYISLGVVEHFEAGPQVALAEAFRVVRPGGLALIEVPFDSPLRQATRIYNRLKVTLKTPLRLIVEGLKLRPPRPRLAQQFYEYRYTKSELASFITASGFRLETILPKDDLSFRRSISLWSDFPSLRSRSGKLFLLNSRGQSVKKILGLISPFASPALIVAIARKPKSSKLK